MLEWTRSKMLSLARPIHVRLRMQKVRLFETLVGGSGKGCTLLDVGGGLGIAGEFVPLYFSFKNVTVVNISPPQVEPALSRGSVYPIVADGCLLPFGSDAFDWVFSNAVIEHVGQWEKQRSFANEIRRVARKGYFVATPNRYFPIEPHTFLPLYQFLPPNWQRRVARCSPGYLREYEEIHLLSTRALKHMFPEARVIDLGFPGFGNNLVAYYRASSS
jgi:ubiquinone/menaquinone biosynthesis C-methylase UbiE